MIHLFYIIKNLQKALDICSEEAHLRPDQALEVTVEARLALARTSMLDFGLIVETRLCCCMEILINQACDTGTIFLKIN